METTGEKKMIKIANKLLKVSEDMKAFSLSVDCPQSAKERVFNESFNLWYHAYSIIERDKAMKETTILVKQLEKEFKQPIPKHYNND
jgi:hypothetical protein